MRTPFVIIAFCLTGINNCLSQCPTIEGMKPIADEDLRYTFRVDKCEGLFTDNIGSEERISIINFSNGKLNYDIEKPGVISIISPMPDKPIQVEAHPVSLATYYRMDATLNSGEPLQWRVGDILSKIKLRDNNLGVFGSMYNGTSKVYIPVKIAGTNGLLRLVLRSSIDIYDVRWQYSKVEKDKPGKYIVPGNSRLGDFFPNTPIEIPIDPKLKGTFELQITAMISGSLTPIPQKYILIIP